MMPPRWGNVARARLTSQLQSVGRSRISQAAWKRSLDQPCTLRTIKQRQLFPAVRTSQVPISIWNPSLVYRNGRPGHSVLQSAFPTKTVIFFLVLGGLAYYFVDLVEESWNEDVITCYGPEDNLATPLHFNASKDEVDHWLQFHIPDLSAPYKEPAISKLISEQFDKIAFSWMLAGEDAKKENIPTTHGVRLRSNEPCEDYFALGTSPGPGQKPWNFWSVMDGHVGMHTAVYLQWSLIPYLSSALLALPASAFSPVIESTIKETFLRIDRQILDSARTAANWFPPGNSAAIAALAPALSGSCALLAAFDPEKSILRVACVGDSRAVLGRWDPASQSYKCIPLSVDQTGHNPKEVERLAKDHPDEPDVIDPKSGRVLGIAISRAFGDVRWKWENEFLNAIYSKFWGDLPRPGSKTPPYLTAEPEITETEIVRVDPNEKNTAQVGARSDFMIMASDGLWDRISSENAVQCVSDYLEAKARGKGSVKQDPRLLANPPSFQAPSTLDPGVSMEKGYVSWRATPEYFAIEDENAAVCLARNTLGGTRRNLFMGILSVQGPWRRNAVDDTTVLVVFFDKLDEGAPDAKKNGKRSWWPW